MEEETQSTSAEETTTPVVAPSVDKVRVAAQNLVDLYKKSHTIKSMADYRYPGLKELVKALKS